MVVPTELDWLEVLARFACAALLPLAIGTERFLRKKPIDFRPFIIISVRRGINSPGWKPEAGSRTYRIVEAGQ